MGSSNIEQLNSITMENFNPNFLGLLAMSNESFSDHQEFRAPNHLQILHDQNSFNHHPNHVPFYDPLLAYFNFSASNDHSNPTHECNELIRPLSDQAQNFINSTPLAFETGSNDNKADNMSSYSHGGKKRKRNNEKESEKPREVVHVRAKRGQATDSHSLAERLRREKINEKLRSLQDLVPGCYKTMGMAVMLDVIINYVRSLQNQIEFLSMKLSAASLFYDFNSSEMDVLETMQGTSGNDQAQVMERMVGEGYGGLPQFQSWPL